MKHETHEEQLLEELELLELLLLLDELDELEDEELPTSSKKTVPFPPASGHPSCGCPPTACTLNVRASCILRT